MRRKQYLQCWLGNQICRPCRLPRAPTQSSAILTSARIVTPPMFNDSAGRFSQLARREALQPFRFVRSTASLELPPNVYSPFATIGQPTCARFTLHLVLGVLGRSSRGSRSAWSKRAERRRRDYVACRPLRHGHVRFGGLWDCADRRFDVHACLRNDPTRPRRTTRLTARRSWRRPAVVCARSASWRR